MRQLVSRAVASDRVVYIFAAAGLRKPDISILSDEFLAEVQGMPRPHPLTLDTEQGGKPGWEWNSLPGVRLFR